MTSGTLPSNPFVAAGMLQESWLFVGRKDELHAIISRMTGVQATSINVVGAKRIGKSSLLYYFYLTWEQRVAEPNRYAVIYLSLQGVQCQKEENFYQAVAQQLLIRPSIRAKQPLCELLRRRPLDCITFSQAMVECKNEKILPVLCLDDFKELFEHKNEFNDGFYDNLRSLMDNNTLMLVVATQKELDYYRNKHQLTSSFFNLGHLLKLGELAEAEAKDLVCLPASTIPGSSTILGVRDQELVRELGGNHPFLLQIAGSLVCEARQQGQNESWVKKRFTIESQRLPKSKSRWLYSLRWFIWDVPMRLGKLPKFIGGAVDDLSNWIVGLVILILPILVLVGVLHWNEVWDFMRDKLGIK
jgi:uncharacterized protein